MTDATTAAKAIGNDIDSYWHDAELADVVLARIAEAITHLEALQDAGARAVDPFVEDHAVAALACLRNEDT